MSFNGWVEIFLLLLCDAGLNCLLIGDVRGELVNSDCH